MDIEFRPLTSDDVATVVEWLSRPHVAEWWDWPLAREEFAMDYADVIAQRSPHRAYIASADGRAIGFIQSYQAVASHADGWWLEEHDPGVYGIDQFLANADDLGRGIGTAMVKSFVARLFDDPQVTRVQTDPNPANARAVRCYEKAGFRAVRQLVTPDGPSLLMYAERPPVCASAE